MPASLPILDPGGSRRSPILRAAFAALGPWVYVLAVALGGLLWPGYSAFGETISTLTSSGAPNQALLQPLFAIYNLSVIALAFAFQAGLQSTRHGSWGPRFLAAAGVAGLVLFFFPQGPWSAPLSGLGVEHTIVAGLDALFFLLAMGFIGRRAQADTAWKGFGNFTMGWLLVGMVLGAFGAASISAPYAGLAERLSIGSFLVWLEVGALLLLFRARGLPILTTAGNGPSSLDPGSQGVPR